MGNVYETLNEMQQQAVYHTEGPLLILAGAGSGKTRVLTHRIAYLIEEKGVNPYHIMAITFTNKAAGEMRERVDNIVGFGSESIWVSTFHSSCVRILRRYIDRIGYDNRFTIYDTDDSKSVMKDVCKHLQIDTKKLKERTILSQISSAKNELITPDEYELRMAGDFMKKKIAQAYREYQETLKKNNALDFDDLIMLTIQLFRSDKEVLDYYQERFHYVLVDEYQDTNTAQFQLIALLAGKYKNLCVVGDDDQSIYKFRGANIHNILNFEKTFENARVIKLEQNYRSTQTILDAANDVIMNNTSRKSKTLWTENDQGDPIGFAQLDSGYEEAEYVARDIRDQVEEKGLLEYNNIAILYRTNAQSRMLEERLMFLNIPYKLVGGVNFYQRREIKDILAYLKTIDNARDDLAVKRIINVPKRGIGLTTLGRISDYSYQHNMTFYEGLKNAVEAGAGRAAEKIDKFVDLIANFRGQSNFMTVSDLLEEVLEKTGYRKELELEDTDEAKDRILNLNELVSKAVDYEERMGEEADLDGFLEEVALVAEVDNLEEDRDYVTLMTVHSAKGLEFPKVYLCGMEDGLFPSYMSIVSDDPDAVEEERRLCYVAITRAMDSLTITCARQRMIRGETQFNKVSRFVKEILPQRLEAGGYSRVLTKAEPDHEGLLPFHSNEKETFARKPFAGLQTGTPFDQIFNRPGKTGGAAKKFGSQDPTDTTLSYGEGDRVKHQKFGEGIVEKIISGGRDYEVTVNFDRVGVKKMFAAFAKLKKI